MKSPTLVLTLLALLVPEAAAQIGSGRDPIYIGQPESGADYGGGGNTYGVFWTRIEHWSSGDYAYSYIIDSRDRGTSWNYEYLGSSFSTSEFDYKDTKIKGFKDTLWRGVSSYDNFDSRAYISSISPTHKFHYVFHRKHSWLYDFDSRNENAIILTGVGKGGGSKIKAYTSSGSGLGWSEPAWLEATPGVAIHKNSCQGTVSEEGMFCASWIVKESTGNAIYFSSSLGKATWVDPIRVDSADLRGGNIVLNSTRLLVSGSGLHIKFEEQDPTTQQTTTFLASSWDHGSTWYESEIVAPNISSHSVRAVADPTRPYILVSWIQLSNGVESIVTRSSNDGGFTFPYSTLIEGSRINQPGEFKTHYSAANEGRLIVTYLSNSSSIVPSEYAPYHAVSINGGSSWEGPYQLTEKTTDDPKAKWGSGDNDVVFWASDATGTWSTGTRYPMIHASADGHGNLGLTLAAGVPRAGTPATARWAISTVLGSATHPDNLDLRLDLGYSPSFRYTTRHIHKFSSRLHPQGDAHCIVRLPSGLIGPYYVQGWVDYSEVHGAGGSQPSDVISIMP